MSKYIKPVDIIVVAVVFICTLLVIGLFTNEASQYAVIYVNGNEFGRYSLHNDQRQIVEVSTEYGCNTVVIDQGNVWVSETDCKDKVEVNAGRISKSGQSLVCLPNRLVVTVEGRINTDATAF